MPSTQEAKASPQHPLSTTPTQHNTNSVLQRALRRRSPTNYAKGDLVWDGLERLAIRSLDRKTLWVAIGSYVQGRVIIFKGREEDDRYCQNPQL